LVARSIEPMESVNWNVFSNSEDEFLRRRQTIWRQIYNCWIRQDHASVGRQRRVSRDDKIGILHSSSAEVRQNNGSSERQSVHSLGVEVRAMNRYNTEDDFRLQSIRIRTPQLIELCCATISRNTEHFNIEELGHVLPEELFHRYFPVVWPLVPLLNSLHKLPISIHLTKWIVTIEDG